ncbi:DNA repair protein RadA [Methylocella tundrae]|uniref:DNA repair protein RadA n=1 Tax=Methylocella tundrae TaxID=227605 RepID=A0A8B6M9K4_METTU|nr:DNA repair protein RadA [Methylocella tundrae]VTZ27493.1 DNA repair protein RadA [Methylocella tundrae]VTZ50842.1 DNA repair protein RadA [Methylocella tundrae]
MAKPHASFVCQNCGAVTGRWQGRCEACGEWNTITEESAATGIGAQAAIGMRKGRVFELSGLIETDRPAPPRILTGIGELDRVTGGGFVSGSVLLLGGEPGIGKSTLLIQACAALAAKGQRVVYISGEEAVDQVRLRAQRLGLAKSPVELAAETSVEDIIATLSRGKRPSLVVIDSIQTMWTSLVESTPGTVSQVRGAAQALIRFAKTTGAAVILVGHVTKDGQIAGPRVVEHMVDAVLSFEGEGGRDLRLLRAVKNRFGPTDEIGVFEMTGRGLAEVGNPSALFLSARDAAAPGAAVFAGMEGSRPLLVEFQALVAQSSLGTPRRAVVGWDASRLAMIVAVLETHAGVKLSQYDIYLTVAGGLRVGEPAADLAAAAALVSSLSNIALSADSVFFGEIALSGAIRPVAHGLARLKEAAKLGFCRATIPHGPSERGEAVSKDLAVRGCKHISGLAAEIGAGKREAARQRG